MFCQTCRDYPELADKNSSMYLGTSAFRKDTLISHWKSVSHKWCEDKKKVETKSKSDDSTATSSGPLVEVVKKMEHGLQEQIIRLINTAYIVAKYEKPLTDYPRLILLQEVNGLDMGNFYMSDNACRRY